MFKRFFLKTLYKGDVKQLLYLLAFCLGLILVLTGISYLIFNDGTLVWQDVVALFLDPGVFGGSGDHDWFRLIVAIVGVLTFSSLLISLFTNIVSSLVEAFRNGEVHFKFNDHVLIIGADKHVVEMLKELSEEAIPYEVVIMTERPVAELRDHIEHELDGNDILSRILFIKGCSTVSSDLAYCHPSRAKVIYVVGDSTAEEHDSTNIRCMELLKKACVSAKDDIPCYVMLDDDLSTDVFRFLTQKSEVSRLKIDFVPVSEYKAEQLLVHTDFLPAISAESQKHSHVVVMGMTSVAKAVASIAAHISHYPNFKDNPDRRTVITIISSNIRIPMEKFIREKSSMFVLCNWEYISETTSEYHKPSEEMGDYMDLEWQFIDADPGSFFVSKLIDQWARDEKQELSIISAEDSTHENLDNIMHLSRESYSSRLAIYTSTSADILSVAEATGQFGKIVTFGPASESFDALCMRRSERGKRVNFVYDQAYEEHKSANKDEAWYKKPEAHKFSSIYCADAMPLRERCIDETTEEYTLYSLEHRRWVASELLLGYVPLPLAESKKVREDKPLFKSLKAQFIHADIAPYDDLPEHEKDKDALIINATGEILR